jgi:hypothetical protein
MGEEAEADQGQEGQEGTGRKRERTLIEFPYTDISRAADLATKLAEAGGKVWIEQTQLAVAMDMSPTGGTFRGRLSAARMFGFIETEGGKVRLSDLGLLLLDEPSQRAALADAFLRVPLYKVMYDSYNGFALPPAAALERQMQASGVPPKQAERARQAFASSAQHAGFIAANGRFSKPTVAPVNVRDDGGESERNGGGGGTPPPPPPPPPPPAQEKKLEYRLVDLMEEAMDDPEALQAILKVITFVKTRDAAKENGD